MVKSVSFKNGIIEMKGNLYTPTDFDKSKKYPAIVVVHPGGGVKEQVSGLYASKISEYGFIALAYDASHQGESGGLPRYLENPYERVEDIRLAIDYLSTLSYVDIEKIGCIGICAGGGYAVSAACTDYRIKAVAGVSTFDIGKAFRNGTSEMIIEKLNQVANQRNAEANGAEPLYINYIPNTREEAEKQGIIMKEAYEYYRTKRGEHPRATNKLLFTSTDKIMSFLPFALIPELLIQPILMICGEESDVREFSEEPINLAGTKKELVLIKGATHVDMYDKEDYVKQAISKLVKFFNENI